MTMQDTVLLSICLVVVTISVFAILASICLVVVTISVFAILAWLTECETAKPHGRKRQRRCW